MLNINYGFILSKQNTNINLSITKELKIKENTVGQVLTCLLVYYFIHNITVRYCTKCHDFGMNKWTLSLHFFLDGTVNNKQTNTWKINMILTKAMWKKCWLSVQQVELNIKILKDVATKKLIKLNKDSWVMMLVVMVTL